MALQMAPQRSDIGNMHAGQYDALDYQHFILVLSRTRNGRPATFVGRTRGATLGNDNDAATGNYYLRFCARDTGASSDEQRDRRIERCDHEFRAVARSEQRLRHSLKDAGTAKSRQGWIYRHQSYARILSRASKGRKRQSSDDGDQSGFCDCRNLRLDWVDTISKRSDGGSQRDLCREMTEASSFGTATAGAEQQE